MTPLEEHSSVLAMQGAECALNRRERQNGASNELSLRVNLDRVLEVWREEACRKWASCSVVDQARWRISYSIQQTPRGNR